MKALFNILTILFIIAVAFFVLFISWVAWLWLVAGSVALLIVIAVIEDKL
jgi:hypothetical protein